MRLRNGKRECVICGAHLDVPDGKQPDVMIVGASGKPNMRAVLVDGEEMHRCFPDRYHLVDLNSTRVDPKQNQG